jgi:hypothetical protein
MAKQPRSKRRSPASGETVKLTIPTPDDLHARLVSYAAMSRPRKRAADLVLSWIRDGLRDWHPGTPKPRSRAAEPIAGTVGTAEGERSEVA